MDLFQLVNPDKMSITCVGYAPSCGRRCRNPIACHNIQAAKTVMRQIVRPGVSDTDLKEMLLNLAEYTLCRRYHQNQATEVSNRWFVMVQRHHHDDDDDDHGSDTSDGEDDSDDGASSTSSSSDDSNDNDNDGAALPRANEDAQELRRRFEELESLQREFEELLQRQRETLQDRMASSYLSAPRHQSRVSRQQDREPTPSHDIARRQRVQREAEQTRQEEAYLAAQREREAAREKLRRDLAEQARREEAQRQAQREREAKAKAETERIAKEQAEKARLDQERQADEKKKQQPRVCSWETAWIRYEAAWNELDANSSLVDFDIRTKQIWPTRSGSLASCCEEDVRTFFRYQPGDVNRRMLRRQALRWHPDRAVRLFARVADELVLRELVKTVTMISQIVIGILGLASQ